MIYIGIVLTLIFISDMVFRAYIINAEENRRLTKMAKDLQQMEFEFDQFDCDPTPKKAKKTKK